MAIKYNKSTLKKLEEILTASHFKVRYERGQFKSGYCLLRDKQIIIINRFYDTKGRIESLLDIIQQVEILETELEPKSLELFNSIEKSALEKVS